MLKVEDGTVKLGVPSYYLKINMNKSVIIMAGGMGSRYGGLKQVDSFGPNNESILDYSIYDSIRAGFNKIIILSSPKLKNYFEEKYNTIFQNRDEIILDIVIQDPNYGLYNYELPVDRIKPWGTGHAILCCENSIDESFITINADDFYGFSAFKKAYDTLVHMEKNNIQVSTISYFIENTLSENGGVSRGVCIKDGNKLIDIEETHDLIKVNDKTVEGTYNDNKVRHPIGTQVAMNLFGFQKSIFNILNVEFKSFLSNNIDDLKSEFLLPEIIGKKNVYIDVTDENWFGVTYKQDSDNVKEKIKKLVETGSYPSSLWNK